jgi:hypothetical protein
VASNGIERRSRMTEKYAKEKENRMEHDNIIDILMDVKEDVGYIRGKVDTMETSNKNLWSMVVAVGALIVAWFKGA